MMITQTGTEASVWTTKTKALAAALMLTAVMAMSLLAPAPVRASAFPGANGKIAVASDRTTGAGVNNPEGDFEIFTMNPDGSALKQLTKNNTDDSTPAYSANGKKIVFVGRNSENFLNIFVMNSDGTGRTNLSKSASNDQAPDFSPDGQKIVFESDRTGSTEHVFVMNADGTGQTDLTPGQGIDARRPVFSPDGKKIAFQRIVVANQSLDFQIFVMGADGGNPIQLTSTAATFDNKEPSFSPDGKKIVFASNRSGQGDLDDFDIFVMNADGTNPSPLTFVRARDDEPAFSPDGKKVAFTSTRDGGDQDVFVLDAATAANQTGLALDAERDFAPNWQPAGATLTVTSTSDPGDGTCDSSCTLREAINASNATPGSLRNTIRFDIPGSGVQTIIPSSLLPAITRPVVVDGYTQPGASPNTLAVGDNAVLRVEIVGNGASGTGLTIQGGSTGSVIRGLAINRFGEGIDIVGDTAGNRIEGNFIGTNPAGTLDRGNADDGVNINGASENVIGGATPAARNVISGNACNAIFVNNGANDNSIRGNYVGTDKTGTKALTNGDGSICAAIAISNGSSGNTVGGTTAGARNLISGNKFDGLFIQGGTGNKVLGNRIGTTANGTGALGNGEAGVLVQSSNNAVGNGTAGGSNAIAFNGQDGVEVQGSAATGNAISRNSVFSNARLSIDLHGGFEDAQGNTANDPGDIDTGPNGLQNKPVISSAKSSSTRTTITGKLSSSPGRDYLIEFYSNTSGGEGKKFIGLKSVSTGSDGKATFTFSPGARVPVGQTVTATAALSGRTTAEEQSGTSEFSAPRQVAKS